jgi:hypothetical protein
MAAHLGHMPDGQGHARGSRERKRFGSSDSAVGCDLKIGDGSVDGVLRDFVYAVRPARVPAACSTQTQHRAERLQAEAAAV